jgi:molybdopterin converting factor small subunit
MSRRKTTVDTVDIKVSRSGSKVETFTLANGNRAVSDALRAAGINKKESETIQVNGEEIDDMDYELEDGDRVVLIKNIEGGLK